eukprot:IDg5381t1
MSATLASNTVSLTKSAFNQQLEVFVTKITSIFSCSHWDLVNCRMYQAPSMCPLVSEFRARFPVAIQATEDSEICIFQFAKGWHHHWPRTWSWRFKLEARAQ